MLLIGSRALKIHGISLPREPLDWDIISTFDESKEWANTFKPEAFFPRQKAKKMIAFLNKVPYEFELAWSDTAARELIDLVQADPETKMVKVPELSVDNLIMVPSVNVLYALKMSHRFLKNNPYFRKTMLDIRMLRDLGARIPKAYEAWYKRREKETYDYKHPSLQQSKMKFFDPDQVTYQYDHDSIHIAMARGSRPAYTFFKKDDAEVAVDKNKWLALDDSVKLNSVIEEAYVLAIERSQVPYPGVLTPNQSFKIALEKVCTSISSGWWRAWAWEHYDDAMENYDLNYMDIFWKGVSKGIVKKANS